VQAIAALLMPPSLLGSISPAVWGVAIALFILLGWSLVRRKRLAMVASIFVQGLSIIVHLLVLLPNVRLNETAPWNIELLVTCLISIVLSALVLSMINRPQVQIIMQ